MKNHIIHRPEVMKAIERKNPSYIPCWYDRIANETWDKYGDRLKNLLADYWNDIIIIDYYMPSDFREPAPGRFETAKKMKALYPDSHLAELTKQLCPAPALKILRRCLRQ